MRKIGHLIGLSQWHQANVQREMQIGFSCHRQMHDWGWISAYLNELIVWDNILEVTYFQLEKLSFYFPADKYRKFEYNEVDTYLCILLMFKN